jgi:hypothetical protein
MTRHEGEQKIRDEFMMLLGAAMVSKQHRNKLAKIMNSHYESLPDGDSRAWWQALERMDPALLSRCVQIMTGFTPQEKQESHTLAILAEVATDITFRLDKRTEDRQYVTKQYANQLRQRHG